MYCGLIIFQTPFKAPMWMISFGPPNSPLKDIQSFTVEWVTCTWMRTWGSQGRGITFHTKENNVRLSLGGSGCLGLRLPEGDLYPASKPSPESPSHWLRLSPSPSGFSLTLPEICLGTAVLCREILLLQSTYSQMHMYRMIAVLCRARWLLVHGNDFPRKVARVVSSRFLWLLLFLSL